MRSVVYKGHLYIEAFPYLHPLRDYMSEFERTRHRFNMSVEKLKSQLQEGFKILDDAKMELVNPWLREQQMGTEEITAALVDALALFNYNYEKMGTLIHPILQEPLPTEEMTEEMEEEARKYDVEDYMHEQNLLEEMDYNRQFEEASVHIATVDDQFDAAKEISDVVKGVYKIFRKALEVFHAEVQRFKNRLGRLAQQVGKEQPELVEAFGDFVSEFDDLITRAEHAYFNMGMRPE